MHEELSSYDRISSDKIHPNDVARLTRAIEVYRATGEPLSKHHEAQPPPRNFTNLLLIGLTCPRPQLYERINIRTDIMISEGLQEEVESLLKNGYGSDLKPMQSIGYKHLVHFLEGEWSEKEMRSLLARDTRRYAKRQYTWFNKDKTIHWFDRQDGEGVLNFVASWITKNR